MYLEVFFILLLICVCLISSNYLCASDIIAVLLSIFVIYTLCNAHRSWTIQVSGSGEWWYKTFINEVFEQSKVHHLKDVKLENFMRIGNKDLIAKQLVRALKLIERQHMLGINQRVQASTYQQEIFKLLSNVIEKINAAVQDGLV